MEQLTHLREETREETRDRGGGSSEHRAGQVQEAATPDSPSQTAWDSFRFFTGTTDQDRYRASYLGSWASRAAFGGSLLEEFGAPARLQTLPRWLQPYVRLEPEAIVDDFVSAGYYHLAELPDVVHVFDRAALASSVSQT